MQGLPNYSPRGPKSGPLPVFINKVVLEHSHNHLFLVYDGFPTTVAELNSHDGDGMVHKA